MASEIQTRLLAVSDGAFSPSLAGGPTINLCPEKVSESVVRYSQALTPTLPRQLRAL
jgi:hypothetical protein